MFRSYVAANWAPHCTFITKIPDDNLLMKMPAELPSTEQIFTETIRLVPLIEALAVKLLSVLPT